MDDKLLCYFNYDHLPKNMQNLSKPFYVFAHELVEQNPRDKKELTNALRKLLEARDCFVRAGID